MKSGSLNLLESSESVQGLFYVHNNFYYPKSHIVLHEMTEVDTLPLNDLHINGF
jgi:hypothetical protein